MHSVRRRRRDIGVVVSYVPVQIDVSIFPPRLSFTFFHFTATIRINICSSSSSAGLSFRRSVISRLACHLNSDIWGSSQTLTEKSISVASYGATFWSIERIVFLPLSIFVLYLLLVPAH